MYKVKFSVRYADLEKMELFPNHASLDKFLKFYSRFDFNEPEIISKYGAKPRSLEDAVASQVVVLNDSTINTISPFVAIGCMALVGENSALHFSILCALASVLGKHPSVLARALCTSAYVTDLRFGCGCRWRSGLWECLG